MKKWKSTKILQEKWPGKMWGVTIKVVPVVVGALGSLPLRLNDSMRTIELGVPVELIQRRALLRSARILKKVLEM